MPQRTALVDADIVVYANAAATQKGIAWSDDVSTLIVEPEQVAIDRADAEIETLMKATRCDSVVLCFSDPASNFRKSVLPTYKATRGEKPVNYWAVRNHLETTYPGYIRTALEGDDIIGILATHPSLVGGKKIMVSGDKDLQTIPGVLYDPGRGLKMAISEYQADYCFMMQTLTGDTTDEYKGCPSIGGKRAAKILEGAMCISEMWEHVLATYISKGLTEEDALVQARCARILRHTDYDFRNKQPILWSPASTARVPYL